MRVFFVPSLHSMEERGSPACSAIIQKAALFALFQQEKLTREEYQFCCDQLQDDSKHRENAL